MNRRPNQRRPPIKRAALFMALLLLAGGAEGYGPFKPRPSDLRWKILKSAHFDVYFYPEEEALARRAAVLAEAALDHDSHVVEYYPKGRQPLFLFQSHVQFQQTNISQEVIGPGTGGFTEAYKNRMVLPTTQSDKWLRIVIAHELTHALQFDVLYGEGQRSFQVLKNYLIPLWVMEGMAEYCAQNWDAYADMVMRDAVINDRVPDLADMDGFSHLDEVYVAYKAGQSAIQYLADTQGPGAVAELMRKYKAEISTGQVLREVTGMDAGRFNRDWKASLRKKYWLQTQGKRPVSDLGPALTTDDSAQLTTNDAPAWSPDGRRIAFITTRRQREEIWVSDADGRHPRPLFTGPFEELGRSGGYGVSGARLAWSPDGRQLAFVRVHDGAKWLCLGDVEGGGLRDLDTGFEELAAPAWSPDGRKLAFSSAKGGFSQIQVIDLKAGSVSQLTHESATSLVTDPAWSPDGAWVAYSAEEGGLNQIFKVDSAGGGRQRLSRPGMDSLMPAWTPDGKSLYYCVNEDLGYDLASVSADGSGYQRHSNVITGVFLPRPSPDGRWLLLTAYEDGCQNLYKIRAPLWQDAPLSAALLRLANPYRGNGPTPPPPAALSMPGQGGAQAAAATGTASGALPVLEAADLSPTAELPVEPYHVSISPDLFFVLLGYDSLSGLVGGGYFSASDMLGDHQVQLSANFVPGYGSVAQLDYLFLKGRDNLGLSLFYRDINYLLSQLDPAGQNSTFQDQEYGGSVYLQHPFSKFLQGQVGLVSMQMDRQYSGSAPLDPLVASTLGQSYVNALSFSLVRDTLTYNNFDIYGGSRLLGAVSYADKALGGTRNFVVWNALGITGLPLPILDRDSTLTLRLNGLGQTGQDRQLYYFGGGQVRGLSYNEYLAEQYVTGSAEFRHPYIKRMNGTLWPLESLLIREIEAVAFYDAGLARVQWSGTQATDVRAGYGAGIRLHGFLFQKAYILFALDLAQRTDKPGNTYYYFTLGQIF